jgi:hypothetical protein
MSYTNTPNKSTCIYEYTLDRQENIDVMIINGDSRTGDTNTKILINGFVRLFIYLAYHLCESDLTYIVLYHFFQN